MSNLRAAYFCFFLIFFSTITYAKQATLLDRNTHEGLVRGFKSNGTLTWHGIPYAAPPIGDLRWKAPQAPQLRKDTLLAQDNSVMCLQKAGPLTTLNITQWNSVIGTEDCLYLNIVMPDDLQADEKLPVMLWIHGGGNSIGYKGNRAYSGETLSAQGRVVFVAINYRLGPLGWFYHPALASSSTKNADASGNYGTLDIIAALEWVKKNIHNFNGDPERITVFGESAGGLNTYSMLASPLAKGLFHRAIVESGGYFTNSQDYVSKIQKEGGHAFSSSEIIKKVLRKTKIAHSYEEAQSILSSSSPQELSEIMRAFDAAELINFYPTRAAGMLDFPALNRDGHVLPFKKGEVIFKDPELYNSVPVILGTNRDENKTFLALDPELVSFPFRIKDKVIYNKVAYYLSNMWKVNGVDEHARSMSSVQDSVYAYRFDWDDLPSILYLDLSELIGAGHGLEIPFVFGEMKSDFNLDLLFGESDEQRILAQQMLAYWTNFAHSGSPNEGPHENLPVWSQWKNDAAADKFIILDAGKDALKMSSEDLSSEQLKQELENDPHLSEALKCNLYQSMFLRGETSASDQEQYASFHSSACKDYPIQ